MQRWQMIVSFSNWIWGNFVPAGSVAKGVSDSA